HSVALLVTNLESSFSKKATETTYFTCEAGDDFFAAVAQTIKTGEPVTVTAESIGRNKAGDEIARFSITWSFKRRR
ncbi:MAG: thioesterase, partial [Bacteroidia bacterium]